MKQLIIQLIITLMTGLPVYMHAQYYSIDRQPFSHNNHPTQLYPGNTYPSLRSPGDQLPNDNMGGNPFLGGGTGGGGPWDELPNGNEGGGGWVGMPVGDTYWFLLLLSVGYGLYRCVLRRNKKKCNFAHSQSSIQEIKR